MYKITRKVDGKYACWLMYQDGHDTWVENTMEKAIESMISGAKVWNGTTILEKDIEFYQEKPIQQVTVERMDYKPWHPYSLRNGGPRISKNDNPYPNSYYPAHPLYEVIVSFTERNDAEKFKRFLETL